MRSPYRFKLPNFSFALPSFAEDVHELDVNERHGDLRRDPPPDDTATRTAPSANPQSES